MQISEKIKRKGREILAAMTLEQKIGKELLEEGEIALKVIDDAVLCVLSVKLAMDLFHQPYTPRIQPDKEAHMKRARKLCRESMVLLKNKDNILPLSREQTVAAAGPMLRETRAILGSWTLDGDESQSVSILDGLKKQNSYIIELDCFASAGRKRQEFAKCDTVILALGESHEVTGEARSLAEISIAEDQKALIKRMKKLGKKVIAVISAGRPLVLEDVEENLDAILYAWHGGTQTGNAVADLIFGADSPSGRLPVTFPRTTGQIPIYYNVPPSGRDVNGYYAKDPIMMNYEDQNSSPMYPFGFGLSYTSFEYSLIMLEKYSYTLQELQEGIDICIKVKNVGSYDSKEVVQCYIRDKKATMTRPVKELKAIRKILLREEEEKTVIFQLNKSDFSFYNGEGKWVVETGEFDIFIGENALTDRKVTIAIL